VIEARDLIGHANIRQTSTYLQSTVKSLGLAIGRKEAHEREQAENRREWGRKQLEQKNCHADHVYDNAEGAVVDGPNDAQGVKHTTKSRALKSGGR